MKKLSSHSDWSAVETVIETLTKSGFVVYLAGGAVRDLLLAREIHDFDLATNALPEDVERIFDDVHFVGRSFGVSLVKIKDVKVEVARFRKDIGIANGRHPQRVEFCDEREDALRRDFTINALFLDWNKKVIIDYVGGYQDLKKQMIKCVGDPELRFQEDYLRVLRLLRFQLQLNFSIHLKTLQQAYLQRDKVLTLPKERIKQEIDKALTSGEWQKLLLWFYDFEWLNHKILKLESPWMLFESSKKEISRSNLLPSSQVRKHKALFLPYCYLMADDKSQESGMNFIDWTKKEIQRSESVRNFIQLLKSFFSDKLVTENKLQRDLRKGEILSLWITFEKSLCDLILWYCAVFEEASLKFLQNVDRGRWQQVKPLIRGNDLEKAGVPKGPEYKNIIQGCWHLQLSREIKSSSELVKYIEVLRD